MFLLLKLEKACLRKWGGMIGKMKSNGCKMIKEGNDEGSEMERKGFFG